MANINWTQVGADVEQAVMSVLGANWQTVSSSADVQLQAMIAIGQNIERDYAAGNLDQDEYNSLRSMQKNALEGILSGYDAIGIVVAEQAAAAAWGVVANALSKLGGIPFAL